MINTLLAGKYKLVDLMEKLTYTHFPDFAAFLLNNKLNGLVAKQLELSHEVKIPLLKLLEHLPPEQLLELSKASTSELLKCASTGQLDELIRVSVLQWRENLLPAMLTREQVVVEDITLASFIRKKALLHFLPEYTADVKEATAIMSEIDDYIQKSEAASFEVFVEIQQKRLQKSNTALEESESRYLQSNKALERTEDRYQRMILEVEEYAIIRLSAEGIVENWNRGAEKIKGYKAEEIVGKSFRLFYTPEDLNAGMPDKLLNLAATEGRASMEGWRVRKDGSKFWGSITITALHDDLDNVIGYTKVTRDLTNLKHANDLLEVKTRELERSNKELTSFSYVASHDLQEPLRKIMMFSQLLVDKESDSLSARGKEILGKIHAGTLSMKRLIEDLLSYSRVQSFVAGNAPVDLNLIMKEVENAWKEGNPDKPLTINYPKLPSVNGIAFQLYQLFENIISNAAKYARPDVPPKVDIDFQVVNGSQVRHEGAHFNIDYYKIAVADNGIGFEQQYAEKIFEIFQRLHKKGEYTGTGIGLAICKKIVQNHHGFIEAYGVPDIGATFVIYLPA